MPARKPEETDLLDADAVNAGDVNASLALYEPGASFVPGPGQVATGIDAIRQVVGSFFDMKPKLSVEVEQVVQAGDIAPLYSRWTFAGTGRDGSAVNMSGRATKVVRQQPDGTWRYVIDDPFNGGSG